MAMMKLDTHIGSVIDPYAGAQKVLANVGTLMKGAEDIRTKKTLLAEQQKKDALAQQQQQFADDLATQANARAEKAAILTNSVNQSKLDEYNRLKQVKASQSDVYNILSNPNIGITTKLDFKHIPTAVNTAVNTANSNGFSLVPGSRPSTVSINAPAFPTLKNGTNLNKNTNLATTLINTLEKARNSTPELKALYTSNHGHISQQELDARKAVGMKEMIDTGATFDEASTAVDSMISKLYGSKYTTKDVQAQKDYNLKMFKALYPAKSGNNITINADGTTTAGAGKPGKNYTTTGGNDNFDPNEFYKQVSGVNKYMGSSTISPDGHVFDGLRRVFGNFSTSNMQGMAQGVEEANRQLTALGKPTLNTSNAIRVLSAMPKETHWFVSSGFKNADTLKNFGTAIILAANKQGSDNSNNYRKKVYDNTTVNSNGAVLQTSMRNAAIKKLETKNMALNALVGHRKDVGIIGESTYKTSHINRILKDNPLHTIKDVNEVINLQMQNPGKFKQYIKQMKNVDPSSASTIINALQANNKRQVDAFIELSKTPNGVQTIVNKLNTLDPKSAEYKYNTQMLSLGNDVTKALAKGSYGASTSSHSPIAASGITTSKKGSESSKKRAEALKRAMYLKTHPLEAPMVETNDQHTKRVERVKEKFNKDIKFLFDTYGDSNKNYVKKQLSKYSMYLDVDKLYNEYKNLYKK